MENKETPEKLRKMDSDPPVTKAPQYFFPKQKSVKIRNK